MRILGIDPGYERLGIAILEKSNADKKEKLIFSTCFKTSQVLSFEERLLLLGKEIHLIIKKYKPEVLAIEKLFLTSNQKSAMHVAETRGVILYEAIKAGLKIFEASPGEIKLATTGYGKADKEQVIKMVKLLIDMPSKVQSNLNTKDSDDELDAIAIGLTAFAKLRF